MVNERERFLRTFNFQSADHVPDVEFGYWTETYARWHQEGLPKEITDEGKANKYFGFERRGGIPVNLGMIPVFETKVVEEDAEKKVIQDSAGVLSQQLKQTSSIPHYLKFPVETRHDFLRLIERYDPDDERRKVPEEKWQEYKKQWARRDYPIGVGCGGFYGWLRGWMGMENLGMAFVTQPGWIEEMMDWICNFVLTQIRRAVVEGKPDFATWWEDMCFNKGPLISPRMFKEFMVPRYRRITDFLAAHGCKLSIVDCDGNINELVPLWLEAGVNVMFPVEVAAGSDPIEIRKRHGRRVLLLGGVNKRALAKGKKAIDQELKRLAPLLKDGGFIPHVDHRVPPDVSYGNYLYYLKQKRRMIGVSTPVPEPA